MAKLLSDRAAEWLRDEMAIGGIRLKPRRIVHKGGGEGESGGCFPVYITEQEIGGAFKGARYRLVGKQYSRDTESESDRIYFPHLMPSTAIPMGATILAHEIPAHYIQSSKDT